MKLQGTLIIPDSKLAEYLLVPRPEDDKSKFLAQVGFTLDSPDQLKQAILSLVKTYDAISDRSNRYGTYYLVEGVLLGPNGNLEVVTVWIERNLDGVFQFVTLKPKR
ncbi:hypothetical protein IQ254_26020 [Nodosilinea sp. LEGE 07088]|uniref:DUF6883 domain-containing protein n=1 Tax=Nodosilinea sp. LEGE 07088 TaxID=2777968 RepID=UPI00188167A8|nr:DUF6883 domain-containing protein [Nodosilinea sp. LEGE 07088]MBE9140616.1 hypothetical protein [Nodosilinea sp. LEGE 07088]